MREVGHYFAIIGGKMYRAKRIRGSRAYFELELGWDWPHEHAWILSTAGQPDRRFETLRDAKSAAEQENE